jgi:hypothetical protein
MTPKEKAKELFNIFNKFAYIEHLGVYGEYDGTWEWSSSLWRQQAKQCALIAIELSKEFVTGDLDVSFDKFLYLQEVEQEIKKL